LADVFELPAASEPNLVLYLVSDVQIVQVATFRVNRHIAVVTVLVPRIDRATESGSATCNLYKLWK
jgi:hypothetical protein